MTNPFLPLTVLSLVLGFTGGVPAQGWVELVRVPERIEGTLETGQNLLLTARVRGTKPEAVWLEVAGLGEERARLTRAGAQLWQINLATGPAARLLGRRGRGTCSVVAGTGDELSRSVAIGFDVEPFEAGDEVEEPPPRHDGAWRFGQLVLIEEGRRRAFHVRDGDVLWCVPEKVQTLELRSPFGTGDASVKAEIGADQWALAGADERVQRTDLSDEQRAAWRESEALVVQIDARQRIVVRAVPRAIPAGRSFEFSVGQRQTLAIPGTDDSLEVSLGDITRGQVGVSVRSSRGVNLVRSRSMRVGDVVEFDRGTSTFQLRLSRLQNNLIGEDRARFELLRRVEDG